MSGRNERQLNPTVLSELLVELQRRLDSMGVSGHITIAGGAALALMYPNDESVRATTDVDALYDPSDIVLTVAREIAVEQGLHPRWLNASGSPWLRAAMHRRVEVDGEFRIDLATPRELMAMKLAAGREQDLHDLKILVKNEGIRTAEELVDIAYAVFGEDDIALPDGRESYLLYAEAVFEQV